ncbi:DNA cytosine methyltransferase [Streptomyces capparidis]
MVDLFAGPGGLDVAAHWLGISVVGVEWDRNACATREAARLHTEQKDVRDSDHGAFAGARILAGGPPCQTYTVAGSGAGRRALDQVLGFVKRMAAGEDVREALKDLKDERTGLVLQPLKWALGAHKDGHPYEAIVLEQVPAVLPVWRAMKEALEAIGYKADCGILHTEEFGVPQTRRRAILIANRNREVVLPQPTHQRYRKGVPRLKEDSNALPGQGLPVRPWVTMGEALGRSDEFVVVSNYGTGGDPKARGRRRWDEPSATVTGKVSRNVLKSPGGEDLGRFSLPEAGRLQTFPMDYPWRGGDRAQQIGNAIPPRLAAHVLAAALGRSVDSEALDAAVDGRWEDTRKSHPLAPRQLADPDTR